MGRGGCAYGWRFEIGFRMSLNLYTILQEGRRGGEGRGGGGGGGGGGEGRGANAQARERLASFRRAANA